MLCSSAEGFRYQYKLSISQADHAQDIYVVHEHIEMVFHKNLSSSRILTRKNEKEKKAYSFQLLVYKPNRSLTWKGIPEGGGNQKHKKYD
jgi:hypothetical protein